jgi:hypothetical protein
MAHLLSQSRPILGQCKGFGGFVVELPWTAGTTARRAWK